MLQEYELNVIASPLSSFEKVTYFKVGMRSNQLYNTNRFVLQECGDFTLKVSDCEELVWNY